jgi:hypothetical protein
MLQSGHKLQKWEQEEKNVYGIKKTVYDVCYSCEMELNFGLDVSINNTQDRKRIRENAKDSAGAYNLKDE